MEFLWSLLVSVSQIRMKHLLTQGTEQGSSMSSSFNRSNNSLASNAAGQLTTNLDNLLRMVTISCCLTFVDAVFLSTRHHGNQSSLMLLAICSDIVCALSNQREELLLIDTGIWQAIVLLCSTFLDSEVVHWMSSYYHDLLQVRYCENECDCRRSLQLAHFGEVDFNPSSCMGTCDNCARMEAYIEEDVSETAKQLVTLYSSPACNSKIHLHCFQEYCLCPVSGMNTTNCWKSDTAAMGFSKGCVAMCIACPCSTPSHICPCS